MINYLARRIGIWYREREWVENLFNDIINNLPERSIEYYKLGNDELFICLVCGSTIKAYREGSSSSRGMCLSESYIQGGEIDYEFCHQRIMARTIIGGKNCYVIDSYNDFMKPVKIEDHYRIHFVNRENEKIKEIEKVEEIKRVLDKNEFDKNFIEFMKDNKNKC